MPESLIRNISDTARWAAVYRARETERPDALFRDPFARRLAGERGEEIAKAIKFSTQNTWSWIARTYLFDSFLLDQLSQGCDMVVNLAAGLDARPYRMDLPPSLKWIEVDLPEILDYKQELLATESATCTLERVAVDLSNTAARRELFDQLGRRSEKALILSEGLLIYFTPEEAGAFAADLNVPASFQKWILDLASPGLLELLRKNMAKDMGKAAVLKFGPAEGTGFFRPYGWKPLEVRSLLKTAGKLKRLPLFLRLMAPMTPEVPTQQQSRRPWGGVCILERISP
jgi:methyltransferase (TIGR00027 family)